MVDDLAKEIKLQLYERVRSPLLGTFAIAWAAWNFKSIIVLFSGASFGEKIAYWDAAFPAGDWWLKGALYPLLSSLLFIVAYPYPARWVFTYSARQNKRLKEEQQKIEDETPLTQAEAFAIRKAALQQQTELQKQLREATDIQRELKDQIGMLATKLADAEARLGSEENSAKNKDMFDDADTNSEQTDGQQLIETSHRAAMYSKLPEAVKESLKKMFTGDMRVIDVFLGLVAAGGNVELKNLIALLRLNRIDVEYALDRLQGNQMAIQNGRYWILSSRGKELAVRLNLTAYVSHL